MFSLVITLYYNEEIPKISPLFKGNVIIICCYCLLTGNIVFFYVITINESYKVQIYLFLIYYVCIHNKAALLCDIC